MKKKHLFSLPSLADMSEDWRNEKSQGKHSENPSQFRSFPNLQIIKSEGGTSSLFINAHLLLLHHKSEKQEDKEDGNGEGEEGVVH